MTVYVHAHVLQVTCVCFCPVIALCTRFAVCRGQFIMSLFCKRVVAPNPKHLRAESIGKRNLNGFIALHFFAE